MFQIKRFNLVALVLGTCIISTSYAADPVVAVIPLFQQPVGDATEADVRAGKTFSGAAGMGLTGTLEVNPESTGDALESDVRAGKTFSNSTAVGLTGTLEVAESTGDALETDVLAGKTFSNGTDVGLTGSRPPAPVAQTGAAGSAGVPWPDPRFEDNGDGTVTDHLTGLIWLQDANCFGQSTFANATAQVNALASGSCGLTDGSAAGDWQLPNLFQLESFRDLGNVSDTTAAVPDNHHLNNLQIATGYWSSSSVVSPAGAYAIEYEFGTTEFLLTTNTFYVWAVKADQ